MAPVVRLSASAKPAPATAVQVPRPACPQRRALVLGNLLGCTLPFLAPATAQAGWNGPADFLKSRQLANVGKLTAPFNVAASRLQDARAQLVAAEGAPTASSYVGALDLVRRSSCNCYSFVAFDDASIETRASLLTQNLKLADPCTFRIVVKNITMLRDDDEPLRIQAYQLLDEVIRSYQRLDGVLLQAGELDSETRHMVLPLLDKTAEALEALKNSVVDNIRTA